MSATAEPAHPHHPLNARGPGAVIDITHRLQSGQPTTAQGRWNMPTPPEPTPTTMPAPLAGDTAEALRRFAASIEKTFTEHGLTLHDDDTAAAYQLTLQVFARAVEGSQATGALHVDPTELAELLATIRGMEQAPRLI